MMKPLVFSSALLLLLCTAVSCAAPDTPDTTRDTGTSAETESAAVTEDPGPLPDLPDVDYEGYTVRYLTLTNYNNNFRLAVESDGETLNDAAFQRNLLAADRLNVAFETIEFDDPVSVLKQSVMAGDTEYDYMLPHATGGIAAMVTDRLLYDWNDLEYVDFSKPWWNGTMTSSLGIGGKLFYASGDIVMTWQGMQAVIFNKSYLDGMDLEKDLYETVFDGAWTMDYMTKIIKGVSQDLNGDGKMDEKDRYGLLDNINNAYQYMYSFDQRITVPDADGYPVLTLNTERMAEIVAKYYDQVYSGETYLEGYSNASYPTSVYRTILIEGRSFLSTLDIGGLYSYLREIEFDFGILPMPKFDEEQENYRVFCGAGLIGIPSDAENPERSGVIAEALAYYSYREIRPAFFDIVLENKAVRDENSYKVIQLMHENKVFDFGFNFDGTGSAYNIMKTVVVDKKSTDFASEYAKKEKTINAAFNKIIDAVKDME
ncbi:MAG: hypothetical protein ACI3XM_01045 [Eubacteriales bacterium]